MKNNVCCHLLLLSGLSISNCEGLNPTLETASSSVFMLRQRGRVRNGSKIAFGGSLAVNIDTYQMLLSKIGLGQFGLLVIHRTGGGFILILHQRWSDLYVFFGELWTKPFSLLSPEITNQLCDFSPHCGSSCANLLASPAPPAASPCVGFPGRETLLPAAEVYPDCKRCPTLCFDLLAPAECNCTHA